MRVSSRCSQRRDTKAQRAWTQVGSTGKGCRPATIRYDEAARWRVSRISDIPDRLQWCSVEFHDPAGMGKRKRSSPVREG